MGVLCLALLVASSGCLNLVTGGTASFEASPATVEEATLDETGYALANQSEQRINRTFQVAGQERTVRVTNHLAQYERNVSLGPLGERDLARFVVLTTPAVEIAGQTFNPVGQWSEKRIVEQLSSRYSGIQGVSHRGNRTVDALGSARTVETFTAKATVGGGQQIDIVVHVAKFRHGDDFVVAVGVHPERLDGEGERVDAMIGGLQH